jgi:ATP-dependent exoDNAse (exonuclease V) beta subunit
MPIAPDITLDESTHTYTDSKGTEYTSVSEIIGKYKAPFDRLGIANKQAAKTRRDVNEILAEWDSAAPYGTEVHKQIECFFLEQDYDQSLIQPYLPTFTAWKKQDCEFLPEQILYHPELKIAGTADMIVRRGDTYSIMDWKTNKAIYKTAFGGAKLSAPLNHLDDCNFVHYSLQLSIYAAMLGTKINRLSLIHLPRDKGTLEIIRCPFLKEEVDSIFGQLHLDNFDFEDLPF